MATDTKLKELIINKLTKEQYDAIEEKDPNQLYIVTDAPGFDNTITNCLTHIPQDINLELNDGTLTLKAGSKVYAPNGAGVFDEVDILSDTTQTQTPWTTNKLFIVYNTNTGKTEMIDVVVTSGSTAPASPSNGSWWYDTGNNQIKTYYDNAWNVENVSLPIAIVSSDGSTITSIDQVFNGFGYIGSTVFVLPGVKGLIPNGRNADGTLKNAEVIVSSVQINNNLSDGVTVNNQDICLNQSGVPVWRIYLGSFQTAPNVVQYYSYYNTSENKLYTANTLDKWEELSECFVGFFSADNGTITSLTPKTVFHAVDYNSIFQHVVVSTLPANPSTNTFYYIPS